MNLDRCLASTALPAAFLAALLAFSPAVAARCDHCGTVTDVRTVRQKGEASGVGAVTGGVLGGVLGHQVGSGRGNTAATIVGAGAGAYAGNEIEKNRNTRITYQVVVKMEDGKSRTFSFRKETSYRAGDRIKVVDGKLTRR